MLHHKNPKSFDLGFFAWAVQDENRAAARSAVSNQPSGLLLSPRFPFFRNVYQESTACRSTICTAFATRSPFRPNSLGLSSVKLERVEYSDTLGPVLTVSGADLMDMTPIIDIKPYLPYTDSHPEALCGFADEVRSYSLEVEFPDSLLERLPEDKRGGALGMLAHDPRPQYHDDPDRLYGVLYAGYDIQFTVKDGVLAVRDVVPEGTGDVSP